MSPERTSLLFHPQLCRLFKDLAAVPDADGRRPHGGLSLQAAVTWQVG